MGISVWSSHPCTSCPGRKSKGRFPTSPLLSSLLVHCHHVPPPECAAQRAFLPPLGPTPAGPLSTSKRFPQTSPPRGVYTPPFAQQPRPLPPVRPSVSPGSLQHKVTSLPGSFSRGGAAHPFPAGCFFLTPQGVPRALPPAPVQQGGPHVL